MPTALYSFKKDSNGRIILHGFLAPNSREAAKMLEAHAGACPQFGPAYRAGQTMEIEVEVDTLPEFEEQSLEEFLELDGDEEEPEEDEDEEEPELDPEEEEEIELTE